MNRFKLFFVFSAFFGALNVAAISKPDRNEAGIDNKTKAEVIRNLVQGLKDSYIFPATAKKVNHMLESKLSHNEYQHISRAEEFVELLNRQLFKITKDKHLRLSYSEEKLPESDLTPELKKQVKERERAFMRTLNYGVNKIERLPFNIGYLDLILFADKSVSQETIAAAMSLVTHTGALIIDLRANSGGDPDTVALLASYFIDGRTHLSDIYTRRNDTTEAIWSLSSVEGKRYGEQRPLFILTSERTFSAAEDFAYTLKHLKRATIVGEVSGGGAHPGDFVRLADHFDVFIPDSRSIHAITQSNWEGVGVQPHLVTTADKALNAAQVAILKQVMNQEPDQARVGRLAKRIEALKKE